MTENYLMSTYNEFVLTIVTSVLISGTIES